METPEHIPRVVIVGAGPSGIGAARTLFQAGIDPIILEARDRIGGRMWETKLTPNLIEGKMTGRASEDDDDTEITIQLGANWIHGLSSEFNPMFERAKLLNLALHPTTSDDEPGDDVILFDSGPQAFPADALGSVAHGTGPEWKCLHSFPQVDGAEYEKVLRRYYWIRQRFDQFTTNGGGILTLSQSFEYAISCSENELGICCAVHRRCLNWIFDRIMIEWAEESLENLTADVYAATGSDGAFGEALVSGGYFQVLEDLALEYPLTVMLDHAVDSVTMMENDDVIEIRCCNGKTFFADYCIVTVPVGVLNSKRVSFFPRVPRSITDVTSKVTMGLMNLVWLLFPSFFWPENVNFFGVARDVTRPPTFTTFLAPPMCDQYGHRQPVLMCQVTGALAKEVEVLSDDAIAAKAVTVLRSMFGQVVYTYVIHC
jgi:polyamine oxidase